MVTHYSRHSSGQPACPRSGQLVSKSQLLDLVWPGVIVEENNLQVQISTLRKLLGAEAIATIPGRGYRWVLAQDESSAPPPREARHSLPAERDEFIGRSEELQALARRLDQGERLVTILGMSGTGKTRLACRYGWTSLDDWPGQLRGDEPGGARATGRACRAAGAAGPRRRGRGAVRHTREGAQVRLRADGSEPAGRAAAAPPRHRCAPPRTRRG